jgi:hypothetical protein
MKGRGAWRSFHVLRSGDGDSQFTVLYRQFLFRLMDVELLSASARGDASQLFGQFASLLLFVSLNSLSAVGYRDIPMRPGEAVASAWFVEYSMVSITMLVIGIFAVFSWDSTFPDKRDVLVLAPLPVRGRTLFAAKIAAVASALGLTVAMLNGLSAFAWPLALAPARSGIVGTLRFIAAFWISLLAAGAFLYCAMLSVQGVAAQLPRRWFLRFSSFLQIAAFALLVSVFCLQPWLTTAQFIGAAENQRMLAWLPSYWFMGLLSELSGAFHSEGHSLMAPLARRAVWALVIAISIAGGAFLLSWLRTLRRIAEEPDIVPGSRGGIWLPRFGGSPRTALAQFIIRTLGRSRLHRMNLAFYLGAGFAMTAVIIKPALETKRLTGIDVFRQEMNSPMLVSSLLMLCVWVVGVRVSFSWPIDMQANWLFRVTPVRGGAVCLSATRCALLALSVVPVCVGCAGLFLCFWPCAVVAKQLLLVGLLGALLADLSLTGFRKIPFTCSYLPGKTKIHVTFWVSIILAPMALSQFAELEKWAMARRPIYWVAVAILGSAALSVRRFTNTSADESGPEIQFEEYASDDLIGLGLEGPA